MIKGEKGETCEAVCQRQPGDMVCNNVQTEFVNDCAVMKEHFPCEKGCWNEVGNDIPAYVQDGGGYSGMCLISVDSFPLCSYANPNTYRLCYCLPRTTVIDYDVKTPVVPGATPKIQKIRIVN